jgi:hypothetical protein
MTQEFDFTNEIDKASWELLKPHHERGAVFVVGPKLLLSQVAKAVAKDEVTLVKIWIDNKELRKLEDQETYTFEQNPKENIANFIVVQPFVLVQFL